MTDKFNNLYNKIISETNNENEVLEEGIGKKLATLGAIGALTAGAIGLNNKLKEREASIPPFPEPEFVTSSEIPMDLAKEPKFADEDDAIVPPFPEPEFEKDLPPKKEVKQFSEAEIHNQAMDIAFKFIKAKEGAKEFYNGKHHAYKDVKGKWTIGYGITDPKIVALGAISDAAALNLLKKEIERVDRVLKKRFKNYKNCNSNQRAALISFHFNLGVNFDAPKMNKHLENGDWKKCAFEFLDCDKVTIEETDSNGKVINKYKKRVKGLTKRRQAEHDLFLTPVK